VDEQEGHPKLNEALSELDALLTQDVEKRSNVQAARQAVEQAKLEDKHPVLHKFLESWAASLSEVIEKSVTEYVDLMEHYSEPDPLGFADRRILRILEPYVGPKPDWEEWPKSLSSGGDKPNKQVVAWVAEVSAGEEHRLFISTVSSGEIPAKEIDEVLSKKYGDEAEEVDDDLAAQWRGPAWLNRDVVMRAMMGTSNQVLDSLLSVQDTQREIALIQNNLWVKLEKGFERGRRKAKISLAKKPVEASEQGTISGTGLIELGNFRVLRADYRKVQLGPETIGLTVDQAPIVKILAAAILREKRGFGSADMRQEDIGMLLNPQRPKLKLKDAFKSLNKGKKRWTRLIASPSKGDFRLNVTIPRSKHSKS
jgi:hypothetical protein